MEKQQSKEASHWDAVKRRRSEKVAEMHTPLISIHVTTNDTAVDAMNIVEFAKYEATACFDEMSL